MCQTHGMRDAGETNTNSGSLSSRSRDVRETNNKCIMISVVYIYSGNNGAKGENVTFSAGDPCGNASKRMCHRAEIGQEGGGQGRSRERVSQTEEPRAGMSLMCSRSSRQAGSRGMQKAREATIPDRAECWYR